MNTFLDWGLPLIYVYSAGVLALMLFTRRRQATPVHLVLGTANLLALAAWAAASWNGDSAGPWVAVAAGFLAAVTGINSCAGLLLAARTPVSRLLYAGIFVFYAAAILYFAFVEPNPPALAGARRLYALLITSAAAFDLLRAWQHRRYTYALVTALILLAVVAFVAASAWNAFPAAAAAAVLLLPRRSRAVPPC